MKKRQQIALPPACLALIAALLFGASTPAAKALAANMDGQLLAGVLYLASGAGLTIYLAMSACLPRNRREDALKQSDLANLSGAIFFGGVLAPLLLMIGLKAGSASSASLLLNLEAVFTPLLAWLAFKENFDRRIFFGMLAIAAGGILLSWAPDLSFSLGSAAIIAACFCWSLDNNLTGNISAADPVQIAAIKGLAAGAINCTIALGHGLRFPGLPSILTAGLIGFLGYGVSLVLYIKALRHLGAARSGAYFSVAPFAGAALSLAFLHEPATASLAAAAGLMGLGVWLHLTETHEHPHLHEQEEHAHMHSHDEHHQHEHAAGDPEGEPHSHMHYHPAVVHSHPHFPDKAHRHKH